MVTAAELLEGELPDMARVLTTEMGKTFASAKGEVAKCAMAMRWFAEHAEALLADEPIETSAAAQPRALPAAGAGPGRHAVELPPVAGRSASPPPPSWSGNVGLLKHASERAPDGAVPRGRLPAGRLPRGRLHHPARSGPATWPA